MSRTQREKSRRKNEGMFPEKKRKNHNFNDKDDNFGKTSRKQRRYNTDFNDDNFSDLLIR